MSSQKSLHAAYEQYHTFISVKAEGPIVQKAANMFNVGVRELTDYILQKDGKLATTPVEFIGDG